MTSINLVSISDVEDLSILNRGIIREMNSRFDNTLNYNPIVSSVVTIDPFDDFLDFVDNYIDAIVWSSD